jgi:hypothetical protein
LRIQIQVRDRVVEAVSNLDQLVLIDVVDELRRRRVGVIERLELLGEGSAPRDGGALEVDCVFLGGSKTFTPRRSIGRMCWIETVCWATTRSKGGQVPPGNRTVRTAAKR